MASIYISDLLSQASITNDDFIPIVDSGSLTTFRVNFTTIAAWISSSVTSSWAFNAITSSSSNTSSFAFTSLSSSLLVYGGTPNGTASYSITSSNANTASYFNSLGITANTASNSITASYALTASNSLYSVSASNAITASYALTATTVISASHVISASNSLTASYALTFPTIATAITPGYIGNLNINPNNYYFNPSNQDIIQITSSQVIVFNTGGTAISLPDCLVSCSKDVTGAGGWEGNATALNFGDYPNMWFDLWVIYNSGTTQSASFLSLAGGNPGHSKTTVTPPSGGWDYKALVGSVYYTTSDPYITWAQWFEFGERYRSHWISKASLLTTTPSTWYHWLNTYPSEHFFRFRKYGTVASDTYEIGAEIPSNIVYYERSQVDGYEEFTLYTVKHNTTGSYVIANSGGTTSWMFFNVNGARAYNWLNSSTYWLAYYTAIQ